MTPFPAIVVPTRGTVMVSVKRSTIACVMAAVVLVLAVSGCVSYPAQVIFDPPRFESDSLRVEWAVGINFFRAKLTNLTDTQIDLDLDNSAVVSVDGESRLLALVLRKGTAMIPPKSYVILSSESGVIFGTDILGKFNAETEDRYPLPLATNSDDRLFLKAHTGETLRLYMTAMVRGKKTIYDVPFKITGATRVQQTDSQSVPDAPAKK
jgi:hypothetical protein